MDFDLTVAIPTYNGAERLPAVLEHLRAQIVPGSWRWEILIVDNNSQDETARVVQSWQSTWELDVPLRYCFEPRQGLAYARMKAVEKGAGTLIGFLDDDNWPSQSWVVAACQFGQDHPQVGAFGSQIQAEFEQPPPDYFKAVQSFLVIRNYSNQPKPYQPETLRLPAGAGLVVRKQAWLDSMPAQPLRTQRGGNDYEISLHMHRQGWQIWHNPAMQIAHHIPAKRVEPDYLRGLAFQYGLCTTELLMIAANPWHRPFILARNLAGGLRRTIAHWLVHRRSLDQDPGAACYMAFHLGSLFSPFAYLRKQWLAIAQPSETLSKMVPPKQPAP